MDRNGSSIGRPCSVIDRLCGCFIEITFTIPPFHVSSSHKAAAGPSSYPCSTTARMTRGPTEWRFSSFGHNHSRFPHRSSLSRFTVCDGYIETEEYSPPFCYITLITVGLLDDDLLSGCKNCTYLHADLGP